MSVHPKKREKKLPKGNDKKMSTRIQWETEVLPKVKEVLNDFKAIGVEHPTIRAVYYKLFSMGTIPTNDINMYHGLIRMLSRVRMKGDDPDITPDTFSDESRPVPKEYFLETPEQFAKYWAGRYSRIHLGYDPPIWYEQPVYVEVWIEKHAMNATFEAVLSGLQVTVQPSGGFNSVAALYRAYARLKTIKEERPEVKKIIILYFGDFDPSGESMDDDLRNRLKKFAMVHGWIEFELIRIGVKEEHIEQYNLPDKVDFDTAERLKKNDPRYPAFIKKYGRLFAIELDALAGSNPQAFSNLVLDAVAEYYDKKIWKKWENKLTQDAAREELDKRIKILDEE